MRKDGLCVVCKGQLSPVVKKEQDPFCSTQCARKWHGTELKSTISVS